MRKNTAKIVNHTEILLCFLSFSISFWQINIGLPILFITFIYWSIKAILFKEKIPTVSLQSADIAVVIIVLVEIVTFLTSNYQFNSFVFSQKILFFAIFYFISRFFLASEQLNKLILLFTLYGCLIGVSTLSFFLLFHHNILDLKFADVTNFRHLYQPFGKLNNDWNTVLLGFLPFTWISIVKFSKEFWIKLFFYVFSIVLLIVILLSFSRGVYLSLFVLILFSAGLVLRYKCLVFRNLFFFCGTTLFIVMVVMLPFYQPTITTLSMTKTTSQIRSLQGRKSLWENSYEIVKDYPLTGVGSYNFSMYYTGYSHNPNDKYFTGRVTNTLLQLLIEKGFVGFLAYSFLIIAFFLNSRKQIKRDKAQQLFQILLLSTLVAIIVREFAFSSVLESDSVFVTLSMILIAGLCSNKSIPKSNTSTTLKIMSFLLFSYGVWIILYMWNYHSAYKQNRFFLKNMALGHYEHAEENIQKAITLAPNNAQFYAHYSLLLMKKMEDKTHFTFSKLINIDSFPQTEIKEAIKNYEKALALNENDETFYHNLGWLYYFINKPSKSLTLFQRAISIDPSIPHHHISLGLVSEFKGNMSLAKKSYITAIQLSPYMLDSKFFSDLRKRCPEEADLILKSAIGNLEADIYTSNNPILKAKLGHLLINAGHYKNAKYWLKDAVSQLPSLNRAWYNLGKIENIDTTKKNLYDISALLDKNDYLPYFQLAEYYYAKHQNHKAVEYYKFCLSNWNAIRSEHSIRSKKIYLTESAKNDLIPLNLLDYCNPKFNLPYVCNKLYKLHKEDKELQSLYSNVDTRVKLEKLISKLKYPRYNKNPI